MADVEQLRALDEERPLLGEARLERRQVHFGGIGFDLAEVGIERGFEREVRAEPHLDVGADASLDVLAIIERVAGITIAVDGGAAGDIWRRLDTARRDDAVDPADVAEARRPRAHGARNQDPVIGFVERRPEAIEIQAPHAVGLGVESQLRKRNPQLRGPPIARHMRFGSPHRVVSRCRTNPPGPRRDSDRCGRLRRSRR